MTPNNVPAWLIALNPANASETVYKQWGKDNKYFATKKECKEVK